MAHDRATVARIKGALEAGLKPKQISRRTGIPVSTIKKIATGISHASVDADRTVGADLTDILLGRFMGRVSVR